MRNALFIGCGKSHPAALFVLAICLGAAGTSPAQETNPPEKVREIFVPFKDLNILLENQPRRVLLSRQQYDELLKKARIAPARHVPQAAVLMAADYSGRSDGQRVRITGTLAIDVLEKGLQAVPLDLGGVGLLSAKLDDRDAPIGRAPTARCACWSRASAAMRWCWRWWRRWRPRPPGSCSSCGCRGRPPDD